MTILILIIWAVSVLAHVASHLVISEAYGGEGISVTQYKNDFIKLYNPTSCDVDLAGMKVHYASSIVKQ